MGSSLRRFFLRLVSLLRTRRAETELSREIESHLQLLQDRFLEQGMNAEEARHAARRAFGGVEQAKDHQRDSRTFRWLANSKLGLKLGVRMLAKYPGLSLVAVIGMALAIAIGGGYFTGLGIFLDSTLPFDEGERVISIRNQSDAYGILDASLDDFLRWRDQLTTIRELSAFTEQNRNL